MISIIIPLYNKESTIKDSLHTILSQDFLDYEVVIIDDGSTDKSLERINEIRDSRIKVYRKSNGGPSSARNYGVKKAQGEWIVFLDADDSFLPGALMHFDSLIKSQNGINCFVFNFVCRKNKKDLSFSHITSSKILKNNFFSWCRKKCYPRPGNALIKREILINYPFNIGMKRNEDVEWMFNIMRDNKIFRSSKIVMVYNCDNLQASNIRNDVYEDYLAYLNFENKQIWEKVALYNLYLQCKRHYPIECHNLYPNTKSILLYILLYYCKIANKISKIFFDTY